MDDSTQVVHFSYDGLLVATRQALLALQTGDVQDTHDKSLRRGAILLWYSLALQTTAPVSQREEDLARLHFLADFPFDGEIGDR